MFIGREKELKFLNSHYETSGFDFIPIYGRRRVGKTELIQEFIKNKRAIIYSATEQNDKISLSDMSDKISQFFLGTTGLQFESWDKLFTFVGGHLKEEKLILLLMSILIYVRITQVFHQFYKNIWIIHLRIRILWLFYVVLL